MHTKNLKCKMHYKYRDQQTTFICRKSRQNFNSCLLSPDKVMKMINYFTKIIQKLVFELGLRLADSADQSALI